MSGAAGAPGRAALALRLGVWLGAAALYATMLAVEGRPVFEGSVLAWGVPSDATLTRLGAARPALVWAGEAERLLLSPWLHGSLLGFVLLGLFWFSLSRTAAHLFGPARAFLLYVATGAAGALAHALAHPESSILGAGPFDPLIGLLGAQWGAGWRVGGAGGRALRGAALRSLFGIALLIALFWTLAPAGPAATLRALFGVEALLGALALGALGGGVLGPRTPGGHRPFGVLAIALALAVAAQAAPRAIRLVREGADGARPLLARLEAVEGEARRLLHYPRRATDERRAALGADLDALAAHPFLAHYPQAGTFRAYLAALRPIATGDLRLPYVVEAELRRAFAAWEPHEHRLRLEHGMSTARPARWKAP